MRPNDGRISLWPIGVIGFIVILAVASVSPVERLNSSPPADFVALRVSARGGDPPEAAQYWDVAVQVIQWRYNRTSPLPEQAPPEFSPADGSAQSAARLAYWAKLREDWLRADNWHRTLSIDFSWMRHDAQSVWQGFHDFALDHT
jgi:hypothetical protein